MNDESDGMPSGVQRLSPSALSAPASSARISRSARSQPEPSKAAAAWVKTASLVKMFPWTE
jgi:hypothetical protein